MGGKHRGGLGRLRVTNGTERDAVAVLIDSATKAPKRAIYVRSGEAGAITSVPNGDYRLRFQFGQHWLRERRFCEPANTSEFDDAFDFREVSAGSRTTYSTFEVTLHPVIDGTAKTHSLSNAELTLPTPDVSPDPAVAIGQKMPVDSTQRDGWISIDDVVKVEPPKRRAAGLNAVHVTHTFKIGERVMLPAKRPESREEINWRDDMDAFLGQVATIRKVDTDQTVQLDIDQGKHWWAVVWLTPAR